MSSEANIPLDTETGIITEMALEVSLDGRKFSEGGLKFKFLENDYQYRGVSHVTGPAAGGTVIEIDLNDFVVPNSDVPRAACIFPGYEDDTGEVPSDSLGKVTAIYVPATDIRKSYITCETPPLLSDDALSAHSLSSGSIIPYQMYTIAKVTLELLEKREVDLFAFAYMKDVKITGYDSPSLAYRETELTSLWPRNVNVIG